MEQGLPVNSILKIAQTADGWMYFGTEEGLLRFDGITFSLIGQDEFPGMNAHYISALLGARDTGLWVGTEGDGLFQYKHKACSRFNTSNGLSDDRISAFCEDANGGLWIGTSGGGINYLRSGMITRFDTADGLSCNYIRTITRDTAGRIWVGTQNGLSVFDDGTFASYFLKDGLTDEFIEDLVLDDQGLLWIGTKSGGVNVFDGRHFSAFTTRDGLTHNSVSSLWFDHNGILWIGTTGGGITLRQQGKFIPFTTTEGLTGNLVATLFEGKEGNMWVGSSGTGLDCVREKSVLTINRRNGLPGDVILPVFEDHRGDLWMGIAGIGLVRYVNGKAEIFSREKGFPDHLVLSIDEDTSHTMWIGTAGGGLVSFRKNRFKVFTGDSGLSNDIVVAVHCTPPGPIWIGTTGGGINRFEDGTFTAITTREGLSDDNVNCILEDSRGALWVGTNKGLNRIRGDSISVFDMESGMSDDYVLSLYEDPQGNLWVGTAFNGLNLFRGDSITWFTTKDGLIHDVVLSLLEDEFGYLWISCNKGIYKVSKQQLIDFADRKIATLTPVNYGKSDGMESVECNGGVTPSGFRTKKGTLLFPTMKGVAVIDPDRLNQKTGHFSPVFIREFLVDGQPVSLTRLPSIPSYSRRLEFAFTALDYANAERIRYRCMLEGFDNEWVDCETNRYVQYTNIPAGRYAFKVMASNEVGQWNNEMVTSQSFRLTPPFYRSSWFYLLMSFFILVLIFFAGFHLFIRIQRNRLKKQVEERTNELKQQVEAQQRSRLELQVINTELLEAKEKAESGDRLKTSFINNISHEIRTPLNGILGFSDLLFSPDVSAKQKEKFHTIIKNSSERLMNTITDYMDISLIVSGNQPVVKTWFSIELLLDQLFRKHLYRCRMKNPAISFSLQSAPALPKIFSDESLLEKILSHLLDNAIKFTQTGGIQFGGSLKGKEIEFHVSDSGLGISTANQEMIFNEFVQENPSDSRGYDGSGLGLSIVKGLVNLLGGRVWLLSEPGTGSNFFVSVPIEETNLEPLQNA